MWYLESPPSLNETKESGARKKVSTLRTCLRRTLYGLLTAAAATSAYVHEKVKLPPQPAPFAPQAPRMPTSGSPISPGDSIDVLLQKLTTVEDLLEFLQAHATHHNIEEVGEFLSTYRQSPEEFQRSGWAGPCNNFAEFSAQWAYMHRGKPYVISLIPAGGLREASRQPWHQLTVCRIDDEEWIIFDNRSVQRHQGSLAHFLAANYPEKRIFRFGGAVPFEFAQPNTIAKLWEHAQANTAEGDMQIAPLPQRDSRPAQWGELALTK
jgi:hypothetical protein